MPGEVWKKQAGDLRTKIEKKRAWLHRVAPLLAVRDVLGTIRSADVNLRNSAFQAYGR